MWLLCTSCLIQYKTGQQSTVVTKTTTTKNYDDEDLRRADGTAAVVRRADNDNKQQSSASAVEWNLGGWEYTVWLRRWWCHNPDVTAADDDGGRLRSESYADA